MRAITILLCLAVASCDKPLTNEEIIAQIKTCKDAGLVPRAFQNLDGRTIGIECKLPRTEAQQ